jgi:hypothetical protein
MDAMDEEFALSNRWKIQADSNPTICYAPIASVYYFSSMHLGRLSSEWQLMIIWSYYVGLMGVFQTQQALHTQPNNHYIAQLKSVWPALAPLVARI